MDMRWDNVPWGAGLDEVSAYVQVSLDAQSRTALSGTLDQHQRDRIHEENAASAKAFRESIVEFTGQKTGYDLSVVNEDFAHETSESMAVLQVGKITDYFFFHDKKLWKLVTTDASKVGFTALLIELTNAYGAPPSMTYRDPDAKTEPVSAGWTSPMFIVSAAARPEYATRVITWTWRPIGDRIDTLRAGKLPPGKSHGEDIDPAILDIMNP